MFKKEIQQLWHDRRFWGTAFLVLGLTLGEVAANFYARMQAGDQLMGTWLHPVAASTISMSSDGEFLMHLLILGLPLLGLSFAADRLISNRQKLTLPTLLAKVGANVVMVSLAVGVALSVNLIGNWFILRAGRSFHGMEQDPGSSNGWWLNWQLAHPYQTWLLFLGIWLLVIAALVMVLTLLSALVKNYAIVYSLAFIVWLLVFGSKFGVSYLMQPFTEYNWGRMGWCALLYFGGTLLVSGIGLWWYGRRGIMGPKLVEGSKSLTKDN